MLLSLCFTLFHATAMHTELNERLNMCTCACMYNRETIVQMRINMAIYWHLSRITHRPVAQHFPLYPLHFKSTRFIAPAKFYVAANFSMKQIQIVRTQHHLPLAYPSEMAIHYIGNALKSCIKQCVRSERLVYKSLMVNLLKVTKFAEQVCKWRIRAYGILLQVFELAQTRTHTHSNLHKLF